MGPQSVRINGKVKIPKVWFMPDGNNGWAVLVGDRGLNMIAANYANMERCCFEAVVPSMNAPCCDQIIPLLREHFNQRKSAWGTWSVVAEVLGSVGVLAGIILSVFSPYFLLLGLGGAICFAAVLVECVSKFQRYNNMAGRLSSSNVNFETTYRPFLEILKSEIDNPGYDALEDGIEADNVSAEEIHHVARLMSQSYVRNKKFSPAAIIVYSRLIKLHKTMH